MLLMPQGGHDDDDDDDHDDADVCLSFPLHLLVARDSYCDMRHACTSHALRAHVKH